MSSLNKPGGGTGSSTSTVTKDTPALTVQAPASASLGAPITATASLSGATNPTGTVQLRLYGPSDPTCAGAPLAVSSRTVTGNGSYSSDGFTPTVEGTYRFVASYSVNANNSAASTACGAPGSEVLVTAPPVAPPVVTPDTTPPDTRLTSHPKKTLTLRRGKSKVHARFAFTSTEAGSTFKCKSDGKPFAACKSPKVLALKKGKHIFQVVAIDAAGNRDPTAARFVVKVVAPKAKR